MTETGRIYADREEPRQIPLIATAASRMTKVTATPASVGVRVGTTAVIAPAAVAVVGTGSGVVGTDQG